MMRGFALVLVMGCGILRALFGGLHDTPRAVEAQPLIVTVADEPAQPQQPQQPAEIVEPPVVETEQPAPDQAVEVEQAAVKQNDESPTLADRVQSLEQKTKTLEDQVNKLAESGCKCETRATPREPESQPRAAGPESHSQPPAPVAQQVPLAVPAAAPAAPVAPQQWAKTITMVTEDWCGPCQEWKQTDQPLAEQDGFVVTHISTSEAVAMNPPFRGGTAIPRFRVRIGPKYYDHTGKLARPVLNHVEQLMLSQLRAGQ